VRGSSRLKVDKEREGDSEGESARWCGKVFKTKKMRGRGKGHSQELRVAPKSRGENKKVGFWANKGAALYEPFEGL